MKTKVDLVNFCLIWMTLGLALAWPFQLFLFSYIVIGPLHYLTEINWLDKQDYFLRPKDRRVFLWSMGVLVLLIAARSVLSQAWAWPVTRPVYAAVAGLPPSARSAITGRGELMMAAFVMAAAWLFTERWLVRAVMVTVCLLTWALFYTRPEMGILFIFLLPTVGHVFLFTILFMLYGTLKTRSVWGYANIVSVLLAVGVIALWPRAAAQNHLSQPVMELTFASAFMNLNLLISHWFGLGASGGIDLSSPILFKVQSFLAFAYTYHYLNWFSKTSIIKWHQVKKEKLVYSVALWLASLALYKVDYRLGFVAVSALSILHVVLEFPLNFVSMRAIVASVAARFKLPKSSQTEVSP